MRQLKLAASLFDLVRIRGWFLYLGLPLLGWGWSGAAGTSVIPLIYTVLFLSGAYAFNDVCDAGTDSPDKNPLATGRLPQPLALAVSLILLLAASALGISGIVHDSRLVISMVAVAFYYSLPRIGFKRYPIAGTLANLWIFVPLFWIGADSPLTWRSTDVLLFTLLGVPSLQSQLLHESQDFEEDRRSGARSTVQLIGLRALPRLVVGLSIATTALAVECWRRHLFSAWPMSGFILAAAAVAVPPARGENAGRSWRNRAKIAYTIACGVWLADLLAARFGQ